METQDEEIERLEKEIEKIKKAKVEGKVESKHQKYLDSLKSPSFDFKQIITLFIGLVILGSVVIYAILFGLSQDFHF